MAFLDEQSLIEAARRGEERAWECLLKLYGKFMWAATRPYKFSYEDREDIVQDVCLQLVDAIHRYDWKQSKFSTYVATIASRACIDKLRQQNRRQFIDPMVHRSAQASKYHHEMQEKLSYIYGVIDNELDIDQRRVIDLYYRYGYTYQEIACIMNQNLDWVKNKLHRARLQLKEYKDS